MLQNIIINFKRKSLSQRFLFVIGMLFFLMYFILGLIIIFWKSLPISMPDNYRMAFGVLLIVYSFFRFYRFFNANTQ